MKSQYSEELARPKVAVPRIRTPQIINMPSSFVPWQLEKYLIRSPGMKVKTKGQPAHWSNTASSLACAASRIQKSTMLPCRPQPGPTPSLDSRHDTLRYGIKMMPGTVKQSTRFSIRHLQLHQQQGENSTKPEHHSGYLFNFI